MLIGALENCFNLMTTADVGGKNVHSEIVLSVLMLLMLNWNGQTFFELLFSNLYQMKMIKQIIPCILVVFL